MSVVITTPPLSCPTSHRPQIRAMGREEDKVVAGDVNECIC